VIKIASRLDTKYKKYSWWILIETPGSGRSGLYQDRGLYSRACFIDFGMNICVG